MFIDKATIFLKSGKGGDGCLSFRREKFIPNGGPDGGDGGDGGSIFLEATSQIRTLYDYRYKRHFSAKNGQPGMGAKCYGVSGEDIIIMVPCGTLAHIKYLSDEGTDSPLLEVKSHTVDLVEPGQQIKVVQGGHGGNGNTHYKSSVNQAPRYAQKGTPGEQAEVRLELKLIADIGIVGLPNAGKSTLLAHLTAAKPKIADYPFTTLSPNLGVLELTGQFVTLADIPGLIEGAHKGVGLGDEFLRHVERTKLLIHVVDLSAEDPLHNYTVINNELKQYSQSLAEKKQILVLNKVDIAEEVDCLNKFSKFGKPILISAATGEGLEELKQAIETALISFQ